MLLSEKLTAKLALCLEIAPKKDIRPYLNGVHIVVADGKVKLEVADGHIGAICEEDNDNKDEAFDVIFTRDSIEKIVKNTKGVFAHIIKTDDGFKYEKAGLSFDLDIVHDHKYPELNRVFPNDDREVKLPNGICLNCEVTAKLVKSMMAYRSAIKSKNFNDGYIMKFGDHNQNVKISFMGIDIVIVPMRL